MFLNASSTRVESKADVSMKEASCLSIIIPGKDVDIKPHNYSKVSNEYNRLNYISKYSDTVMTLKQFIHKKDNCQQ